MTDFGLYLITDRHQSGGRTLVDVVGRAFEGGVRAVQLREKDLSAVALYRLATDLRRLSSECNARLIINDRLDIALAVDADGIHIGINSLPVSVARRILGKNKIIGYSAHAIDEALAAEAAGADFVTFGPVYQTPSKVEYGEPCGVKKLAEAASALKIPVIGLGGITVSRVSETLSANVGGIAVISAIMAADDPRAAAASLLNKMEEYA